MSIKKSIHHVFSRVFQVRASKSRDEIHKYWEKPDDGFNTPAEYIGEKETQKKRSQFLVKTIKKYVAFDARIIEIGCNVGRNLSYLYKAEFRDLAAIEISSEALRLLHKQFPDVEKQTDIYNAPVEDVVKNFKDREYDIVFTMAVLEHIHTDSEWIFSELARITNKFLIVIEDEKSISERHFPREYKKIFEGLGLQQVEEVRCNENEHGLNNSFFARVFQKSNLQQQ